MVNIIGGATLTAVVGAEKALEPRKNTFLDDNSEAERNAIVTANLSLPGFNPAANTLDPTASTQGNGAVQPVKASEQKQALDAAQTAIKQFDEGLKKLTNRPETQIAQALGFSHEAGIDLVKPEPLPGVNENGMLEVSHGVPAADQNHDGKVSPDERRRYELPLTYRSNEAEKPADTTADSPSAFSLAEANRAYGAATPPRPS